MLKSLIKKIRSKPKATRDKIALTIAGTFTASIFLVWIYYLPTRLATISENHEDTSSPMFSQLFDEVGEQFSAVKEAVSDESEESAEEDKFKDYEVNFRGETPNLKPTSSFQTADLPAPQSEVSTTTENATSSPSLSPPKPRSIRVVGTPSATSTTGAEIE